MGQSCCCAEDSPPVPTKSWRTKVRPLLSDLEDEFAEFAGEDGLIDAKELKSIWLHCAEKKCGKLDAEERKLIESSSDMYFKALDIGHKGKIDHTEFVNFVLGEYEERKLHDMRYHLQRMFRKEPDKLKTVIDQFKSWDTNGDGRLTQAELSGHLEHLSRMTGRAKPAACCLPAITPAASIATGDEANDDLTLAEDLLQEMETDDDGAVDLWEVIAHTLGRRKTPVELLVYDISKGAAKHLSPLLLGRKFEAIYHTGVLVFGSEYWYGGNIFRTEPPATDTFGPPLKTSSLELENSQYKPELKTVHVGYTLATPAEFRNWLAKEIAPKYRRDNYDVLQHNCNSFSEEAVRFLTGSSIPETVSKMPEMAMQTPTAKVLRPFLNKWLGGFGEGMEAPKDKQGTFVQVPYDSDVRSICSSVLGDGEVVVLEGSADEEDYHVAAVEGEHGDTLDLKLFDPPTNTFVSKTVARSEVKHTGL
mmetsp:Transcript_53554/g.120741  ORF Transcript_53554/g.120741 Transcript_53554/m.120741 type:complete len:476 (+) Transcript_53554:31-1458(+)